MIQRSGGDAMGESDLYVLEDTEQLRIEQWRSEELERAGYSRRAADRLAARHDVDLHRAVDLVRRGCDPELAVRILL
jgi:hypothetical protein